jgi:hypothetical protein
MTRSLNISFHYVVSCPYCKAKLLWFPCIEEGLVARQDCPKCKITILLVDNVARFDGSAKKPPQKAQ